jgi:hypothetical protein
MPKSAHKIQNPASSAGHSRLCVWRLRAKLNSYYPVLIRRLTIGVCSLEYFRPDCESPAQPDTFRKCRTICNLTTARKYVKSLTKLFSLAFHTPVEAVNNAMKAPVSGLSPPPLPCATGVTARVAHPCFQKKIRLAAPSEPTLSTTVPTGVDGDSPPRSWSHALQVGARMTTAAMFCWLQRCEGKRRGPSRSGLNPYASMPLFRRGIDL